jgi:prepilin-type processing-associated H-X9-DG protein
MIGSINTPYNQWADMWHAGPAGGEAETQPAATAILADAPIADLSGQTPDWHGGQGRNVFFEDGHVCVMPSAMSRDAAGSHFAGDASFVQPRVFIPVSFVAGPKHD